MLGNVVEQRREHWQKSCGGVVYILRHTFHLLNTEIEKISNITKEQGNIKIIFISDLVFS